MSICSDHKKLKTIHEQKSFNYFSSENEKKLKFIRKIIYGDSKSKLFTFQKLPFTK